MRKSTFTVNAEAVQGNPDATVTFRRITVAEVEDARAGVLRDTDLLREHLVSWEGFEDDDGNPLPQPSDDPDVLGLLYVQEQTALVRLLFIGPDEADPKN